MLIQRNTTMISYLKHLTECVRGVCRRIVLRSMKMRLLLSFLCVLSLCLFNGWPRGFRAPKAITPTTFHDRRNITILLWYWPFRRPFSLRGDVCWDLYGIFGCRLVDQRSFFPSADVVVFHTKELVMGHQKLPLNLTRPQGQRWAWMSLEAPVHNGNLCRYDNVFNMTITYRRDADVTIPYGELLPKDAGGHLVEEVPLNKSFLVCWVVSNYKSHHRRSKVYKELKATVPVKVYGRWAKRPLPSNALLPAISRCYFYLAMENSVAKDYVTEKLWRNGLQGGAVPVVLGPPVDSYKAVAPPNSFIHVDDFASVKDLGKYLQGLAEDKKRYNEFFTWKQHWKVKLYTDWRERLCKICSQDNSLPQQKVYSNLEAWVNANNNQACTNVTTS
uniref:Fucosyltransferase n=2 Tax=Gasterosteus aculeatus aculeatus TaxID=481459 RepID=A0AAQ4RPE0_GASAC|nr:alpha-(1,3)-fucosyltransferase 7 [Gasterosteus aculeatus aculeatus]XP_040054249.1 alpha-(1,3)-fucosyltransferase 7 [Gasterosteus aculeatus aculeatus]